MDAGVPRRPMTSGGRPKGSSSSSRIKRLDSVEDGVSHHHWEEEEKRRPREYREVTPERRPRAPTEGLKPGSGFRRSGSHALDGDVEGISWSQVGPPADVEGGGGRLPSSASLTSRRPSTSGGRRTQRGVSMKTSRGIDDAASRASMEAAGEASVSGRVSEWLNSSSASQPQPIPSRPMTSGGRRPGSSRLGVPKSPTKDSMDSAMGRGDEVDNRPPTPEWPPRTMSISSTRSKGSTSGVPKSPRSKSMAERDLDGGLDLSSSIGSYTRKERPNDARGMEDGADMSKVHAVNSWVEGTVHELEGVPDRHQHRHSGSGRGGSMDRDREGNERAEEELAAASRAARKSLDRKARTGSLGYSSGKRTGGGGGTDDESVASESHGVPSAIRSLKMKGGSMRETSSANRHKKLDRDIFEQDADAGGEELLEEEEEEEDEEEEEEAAARAERSRKLRSSSFGSGDGRGEHHSGAHEGALPRSNSRKSQQDEYIDDGEVSTTSSRRAAGTTLPPHSPNNRPGRLPVGMPGAEGSSRGRLGSRKEHHSGGGGDEHPFAPRPPPHEGGLHRPKTADVSARRPRPAPLDPNSVAQHRLASAVPRSASQAGPDTVRQRDRVPRSNSQPEAESPRSTEGRRGPAVRTRSQQGSRFGRGEDQEEEGPVPSWGQGGEEEEEELEEEVNHVVKKKVVKKREKQRETEEERMWRMREEELDRRWEEEDREEGGEEEEEEEEDEDGGAIEGYEETGRSHGRRVSQVDSGRGRRSDELQQQRQMHDEMRRMELRQMEENRRLLEELQREREERKKLEETVKRLEKEAQAREEKKRQEKEKKRLEKEKLVREMADLTIPPPPSASSIMSEKSPRLGPASVMPEKSPRPLSISHEKSPRPSDLDKKSPRLGGLFSALVRPKTPERVPNDAAGVQGEKGAGGGAAGALSGGARPVTPVRLTRKNREVIRAAKKELQASKQQDKQEPILRRPFEDVKDVFKLDKNELGRGRFGVIRICTHRKTGERLACKTISKTMLQCQQDVEDVRREVAVMDMLKGHPHVANLRQTFEDPQEVHLVMELCEGGELFDRIKAKGKYSERDSALVLKTVVEVLRHCHGLGVMHRDLKPENILLESKDSDVKLKVIDFGVATFFTKGKPCTDMAGSPYYLAPEVLAEKYGPEADIWSAGVVLYILLSGLPPFWATTNEGIFEAIKEGTLNMVRQPWPVVSDDAKDLVRKMLTRNVKKRISLDEILEHPWIRTHTGS